MDDQLEEMLREDMKRQTESIPLPEDMLSRGVSRSRRRRTVRRRLMAGGGVVGVAILAAGLVFGVALTQGGSQPSRSKVAVKTGASASTTNAATDKKAMAIVLLRKTLLVATPPKGEILHVKSR